MIIIIDSLRQLSCRVISIAKGCEQIIVEMDWIAVAIIHIILYFE